MNHWSGVFTGKGEMGRGSNFARCRVPRLPDGDWIVSRDRFDEAVQSMRASALGRLACPSLLGRPARYIDWLTTGELPSDFNYACLAPLPKVDSPRLAPHEARPLSLANTDSKILATMMRLTLEPKVHVVLLLAQAGFRPGVCILESVLKVDLAMHQAACGHEPLGAALFFDFEAASDARPRVSLVGSPRGGHAAAHHPRRPVLVRPELALVQVAAVAGGEHGRHLELRQVCPLSPVLFMLAAAPIIDTLEAVIGSEELLSMFADDLAIVFRHLCRTLLALPPLFGQIRRHIGFPLWPSWHDASFRREAAAGWASFGVGGDYKYLGILLGPASVSSMSSTVEAEYELRAIRALGLGIALGALAHRFLALSVLGYIMQVRPPRGYDGQRSCAQLRRSSCQARPGDLRPYGRSSRRPTSLCPRRWCRPRFSTRRALTGLPRRRCDPPVTRPTPC